MQSTRQGSHRSYKAHVGGVPLADPEEAHWRAPPPNGRGHMFFMPKRYVLSCFSSLASLEIQVKPSFNRNTFKLALTASWI